ncbi:MAG: dipeptide epimerase [Prevotellaceae bacterium]|nr:dipeptide epimerase [Prevotellaceae bacterium]
MQSRRNFLKTAAIATIGTGLAVSNPVKLFSQNKKTSPGSGKMKLSFKPFDLQLRHVFTVAANSRTFTPLVLVEIEYDGVIGYGEASMPPYIGETQESVMAFLKKVDIGQFSSPFLLDDILTYIDNITANNSAAKASIDIALHDLVGKLMGQPWYKIWGYNPAKAPSTTYTIGIDTADVVRKKTEEVNGLYNILKVKLGRDNDKEMIETIRKVTDVPILADANQGWKDKHLALEMAYWLKERGVVMIEQPFTKTDMENTAWLTERSPLPIYADEAFQRLNDVSKFKGVFTGVNIKLQKCTGMREARKILDTARALNMGVMIGCMVESGCAVTAAAHLSPMMDFADLDGPLLSANDPFKGITYEKGMIVIPDKPGIGVEKIK